MNTRFLIVIAIAAAALAPTGVLAADTPAAPKAAPVTCDSAAGPRIRPGAPAKCEEVKPYRTYTSGDIRRTGKTDLAEAMRRIDPIFH